MYGDRGNIIALAQRCRWRGIAFNVQHIAVGATVDWQNIDLAFFGGGQDSGQTLIADDFLHRQGESLAVAIEDGLVMLAICGGYQLLGHYFLTHTGERLPGIGVLDVHTVGGQKRLIGNSVVEIDTASGIHTMHNTATEPYHMSYLVGFENHSGRTYHGPRVAVLGHVRAGYGDNGEDRTSGVVYRNTVGCYLHGALLPKNPHLADYLIVQALHRRYGDLMTLTPLDDTLEVHAHHTMVKRLLNR